MVNPGLEKGTRKVKGEGWHVSNNNDGDDDGDDGDDDDEDDDDDDDVDFEELDASYNKKEVCVSRRFSCSCLCISQSLANDASGVVHFKQLAPCTVNRFRNVKL